MALDSIINYDNNLSQLLNDIDNLKAQAESLCDTNEIILLEMVFSVAKYSATYWYNNMDKWIQLSQGRKIKMPFIQCTVEEAIAADARAGTKACIRYAVLIGLDAAIAPEVVAAGIAASAAAGTIVYAIFH